MAIGSWRKRITSSMRRGGSSTTCSSSSKSMDAAAHSSRTNNNNNESSMLSPMLLPVTPVSSLQETAADSMVSVGSLLPSDSASGRSKSQSHSSKKSSSKKSAKASHPPPLPQEEDDYEEEEAHHPPATDSTRTADSSVSRSASSTTKSPSPISEKEVYDFVWDYMDTFTEVSQFPQGTGSSKQEWDAFWTTYHTDDYLLVRPSGNTLDRHGLCQMFASGDISDFTDQVLAVESIKLLSPTIAIAVFKSSQEFSYKGQREEDFCTWTAVIVKNYSCPNGGKDGENGSNDEQLRITNIHRSSGKRINAVYKS